VQLNTIIQGDTTTVLKTLPSSSVDCIITSPPYWAMRDYDVTGQIGLEHTPEEYVAKMVVLFREARRLLKNEGTLWLNLGDTYIGSWGNYSGQNRGAGRQRKIMNGSKVPNPAYQGKENWRPPTSRIGDLKPKNLVGIPWRVAFALQADGWYLRQDIIWAKPNPMPESVLDRCTKSHEYVFLFSKSPRYYFDAASIKTESKNVGSSRQTNWASGGIHERVARKTWKDRKKEGEPMRYGISSHTPSLNKTGDGKANKRSVWFVPTQSFREAHFATFPEQLITPMILAGCPKGGLVLDPFFGAGTTGLASRKLGRNYLGIELNPKYVEMARARISAIQPPIIPTSTPSAEKLHLI
jgi:DNA modification methylase